MEKELKILEAAHRAWSALSNTRSRRSRYLRFAYGDQWSDPARLRNGQAATEGEAMEENGHLPLTNNLIRRMIKTVIGRWRLDRGREREREAEIEPAFEAMKRMNSLDELDARTLEEFLISGMAIHHVWPDRRHGGEGVWVDNVAPDRFFISGVGDARGNSTELIGRLIDMSLGEVMMRYAKGDVRRASEIRQLMATMQTMVLPPLGQPMGAVDFYQASEGRCRLIEVWTLECQPRLLCHDPLTASVFTADATTGRRKIERLNRQRRKEGQKAIAMRWEMATTWRCRILAPDGTVLDSYNSPLKGGVHPLAVKLYPMVDGDVHSLVEDVVDQQKHVNRLLTMMDRMMSTAAKGVLLFPQAGKADHMTWDDVTSMWSDPGGVIPYKSGTWGEPHQVVTPVGDLGANALLHTQLQMFQDVSGVNDALMGKARSASVGADRYNMEVENASVVVLDLLETYRDFTQRRDELISNLLRKTSES